jgi:hypothetical protein
VGLGRRGEGAGSTRGAARASAAGVGGRGETRRPARWLGRLRTFLVARIRILSAERFTAVRTGCARLAALSAELAAALQDCSMAVCGTTGREQPQIKKSQMYFFLSGRSAGFCHAARAETGGPPCLSGRGRPLCWCRAATRATSTLRSVRRLRRARQRARANTRGTPQPGAPNAALRQFHTTRAQTSATSRMPATCS